MEQPRIKRQQAIMPSICFSVSPAAGSSARAQGAECGDAPTQRICASARPGVGMTDKPKSSMERTSPTKL